MTARIHAADKVSYYKNIVSTLQSCTQSPQDVLSHFQIEAVVVSLHTNGVDRVNLDSEQTCSVS